MSRFNHYEIPSDSRFSRREFIKLSGTASIAVLTVPMVSCNRDGQFGREHALFQNDTVPVLDQCDSIVVGGSFAGVSAALNFAKNGKKVVLVEQRIYLGREITSTYRPWIDLDEGSTGSDLPDLLLSCIEENIEQPFQNKKLLRFNHIKLTLEKALLSSKVNIVYASAPVQLVMDEGRLAGLVIGNKSGRQVILSKMILDCTETASVIHLTNHGFQESQSENTIFTKILEFNRIEPLDVESIDVPESLGINNNRVGVQRGYLSDNHYYIQCPIEYSNPEFDPESTVRREIDAWEKSIGVARYMYQEVPEFKDAFLTNSSYQLLGIYSTPMKPLSHEKLEEYPKADITFGRTTTANTAFATGIKNLWCISDAARLNPEQVRYLMTPQGACQAGNAVSANLLDFWKDLSDSSHLKTDIAEGLGEPNTDVVIKEKYSPHRGRDYHRIKIKNQPIPVLAEVDLLVVGGGSSGATAAYAAAQTGKKTMVVDLNPGFGGTGTYAGVQDYWGNGK
jgi:hypothetical protein